MSWEVPAADTKYTQQLALDVGDIPGHQVATSSRDECLIVREGLLFLFSTVVCRIRRGKAGSGWPARRGDDPV